MPWGTFSWGEGFAYARYRTRASLHRRDLECSDHRDSVCNRALARIVFHLKDTRLYKSNPVMVRKTLVLMFCDGPYLVGRSCGVAGV
jgi:hypothetical protein